MRTLNASDTIPVSASYFADQNISLKQNGEYIETYYDGYRLFKSDIFDSIKDVSFNKHSFFGLASSDNISNIVEDNVYTIDTVGPLLLISVLDYPNVIGVDSVYEFESVAVSSEFAVMYSFEHMSTVSGVEYYKLNYRDKAISVDLSGEIYIDDYTDADAQTFAISGSTTPNSFKLINTNGVVATYNGNDEFYASKNGTDMLDLTEGSTFGTRQQTALSGYNTTNKWVRYDDFYSPVYSDPISILSVDDANSIYDVPTNMVLTAPVSNIVISDGNATIPLDIIPTKNFKTISYEQSIIPISGLSGTELLDFRDYNRIYTGGNRTHGYSNISLGYGSEYSSVIEFKADEYTYFHTPLNTSTVSIQEAGFGYAGAFAGIIPEFSDRIYKRLSNYEDTLWWGGGSHNGIQDGTWLCAWLSADDLGTGTWVERYYDPGSLDSETALSTETNGVVEVINFNANTNPVQDITSNMTIEGGAYYKYYHIGPEGLSQILSTLKGIDDTNTILKFENFDTDNIVNDESTNNNDGTIYNFDSATSTIMDIGYNTEDFTAILLDSVSDIRVDSDITLDVAGDMSIVTWLYSRDWTSGRSSSLMSHYHKSGYKLEYVNHGSYYSYIVPNNISGTETFTIIPSQSSVSGDFIIIEDIGGDPVSVAVDSDNYLWVAVNDGSDSKVFKLTASGTVLESITLEGITISQIIIKDEDIAYLKDASGIVYTLDLYSVDVNAFTSVAVSDYIYMTMNSDIQSASLSSEQADSLDIFADGTVCKIYNGQLYEDSVNNPDINGFEYVHVCCDDDTYYYATTQSISGDSIRLYKIDKGDNSTFESFSLSNAPSAANFTFISKESVNDTLTDVIYWVRQDDIAKYYIDNGVMVPLETIDLTTPFVSYIDGDHSGYRFNKRTNYAYGSSSPYLKFSAMMQDTSTDIISKQVATTLVSGFTDNWHQISIVKNPTDGELVMYVDADRVATTSINTTDSILYFAGSILSIGGAIDGSDSLFDNLGLTGRTLNGGVSDTAIYNAVLDDNDVQGLYYSKFDSGSYMRWVLNTGLKDYIEEIQYMFKYKKPGIKSQYFNLVVKNLDVIDSEKSAYESHIRAVVQNIIPANMKLVSIIWR